MSMRFIKKIKENLNDDFVNTLISLMCAGINNSKFKIILPTKNGALIKYFDGSYYKITCFPNLENIESIILEMNTNNCSEIYNINYISDYEKILRKTTVIDDKIIKRIQIFNDNVLISENCEEYEKEKLIMKKETFKNSDNLIFFKKVSYDETEKIEFRKSNIILIPCYNDFSHLFLMEDTDMNRYDFIMRNLDDDHYTKKIDVMEYYNEYNKLMVSCIGESRTRK